MDYITNISNIDSELMTHIQCFVSMLVKENIPLPSIDHFDPDTKDNVNEVILMWDSDSFGCNVWFDKENIEVHFLYHVGTFIQKDTNVYTYTNFEELLIYVKQRLVEMGLLK